MNNIDRIYTKDIEKFSRAYFDYLKEVFDKINLRSIKQLVELLLDARENRSNVFFIGNGGSAATASHFANDLSIGTNDYARPFRVMSLTDNVPILTALGNDFGYEEIFVRQIKVLADKGDLLVGISASGNSPNMIKAFEYANENNITTFAITAFDGGKMKSIAKYGIHIPTGAKEYGPAEDAHMILDHLIGSYLMRVIKEH